MREIRRRRLPQTVALYVLGAWVLMQVADVLFPGAGIPEYAIRYVFIGAIALFPVVLVFGWRYNFTAGGIRRTGTSTETETPELELNRRDHLILSVLGVVGVLIVGTALYQVAALRGDVLPDTPPALEIADNSIAVFPFEDIGNGSGDDYLGAGIAEQLRNELASIQSLRVAARTSTYRLKDEAASIRTIGRQLGVRTVLEGSVRRAGNQLRITAQLINTDSGYEVWSDSYDVDAGSVFEIQERIARAITDALEAEVLGEESERLASAPTRDFQAYDYLLLGSHYREMRNPESLETAIDYFERAIELDRNFALGHVGLATAYLYQAYHAARDPDEVVSLATPLLEEALRLEPDLHEAHSALGSLRLMVRDFAAAEEHYQRALAVNSNNAAAWSNVGFIRVLQSRLGEAEAAYGRARELDPLNDTLLFNMGALNMLRGNYVAGLADLEKVLELSPERVGPQRAISYWAQVYGDYETSARWIQSSGSNEGAFDDNAGALGILYLRLGLWERAYPLLERAYDSAPNVYFEHVAAYLQRHGEYEELYSFMADELKRADPQDDTRFSPINRNRFLWHGVAAYLNKDLGVATSSFLDAAGGAVGIDSAVYDEITPIQYLAMTYQGNDRTEEAAELLELCDELTENALGQGWNTPAIHYRRARTFALMGRTDDAIHSAQTAVNHGWLLAGDLEHDPVWDSLRDDPRFETLVADVNIAISDQHAAVLEITER